MAAEAPRAVILAAGQGTRMKSTRPKVLHLLGGRPLLEHVVAAAEAATGRRPIVVVGAGQDEVTEAVADRADPVVQEEPLGSGHALRSVPAPLRDRAPVVVLYADVPLLRTETIAALVERQAATGAACVLLSFRPADPRGMGRIRRDAQGRVTAVVEERDLAPGEPVPEECNAGAYVFDAARLWPALERLTAENAQGELYLTEVVGLLAEAGGLVEAVALADPAEALGVNDRIQLAQAEAIVRLRTLTGLMASGVTVEDPATTYVDAGVEIGPDSVIRPMTVIRGRSAFGRGCEIGPGAQLRDVRAGDGVRIGSASIEVAELGDGVEIGPWCRVRPGTSLASGVSLGTHAEVKNSRIGEGTRINHFSCVLDSDIGRDVNVGAGTVTCNYDGAAKHRTTIGDSVFVGSNTTLVAPLTVGDGAYIAAASVVTGDVPAGALAVGRAHQRNIAGWAERRRNRGATAGD